MATITDFSAVFVLCILVVISLSTQGSHGQMYQTPSMAYYPQMMQHQTHYVTMSPIQMNPMSLQPILQQLYLLNNNYLPMNLIRAKNRLMNYLSKTNFNFAVVINRMDHFQNLQPLDRMIGLLLNIQQLVPLSPRIRIDLDQILAYVMMESYLTHVPMLGEMVQNTHRQTFVGGKTWFQDCENSMELNKRLFLKLMCCERSKSQVVCPPQKVVYVDKPVPVVERVIQAAEPVIQFVDKPCPTPTLPTVVTHEATEMTATTIPVEPEFGMFHSFITYIPQPKNKWEQTRFDQLKLFLERKDLGTLIGEMSFAEGMTHEQKLQQLLLKASAMQWDEATMGMIQFYLNFFKNSSALSFSAQKEIRKQFDLTQIIIDSLNFDSFSAEGKIAFGDFYTFMSGISGQQLKDFTEWSEVKTRGEFMEVLFDYFLKHEELINEKIKQAIIVLKPLLSKDGAAALPP